MPIIPSYFPHPMLSQPEIIVIVNTAPAMKTTIKTVTTPTISPKRLPYPATDDNEPKLGTLKDAFKDTAFNISPPFPAMNGPPAHIHLKPDVIPCAKHELIPVP